MLYFFKVLIMRIFTKAPLKTLLLLSLSIVGCANALLPNPTQSPTLAQPQNLAVLPTTPPPLLNQAVAQHIPPMTQGLSQSVYAFLVTSDADGVETLVPVSVGTPVKAGDTLEYRAHFTNHTGERIRRTSVSVSIPDGVELVGGIMPIVATASVDNNRFSRVPLRANINGEIQNLPYRYYKALRWSIEDIGLGGTAVVKYRAVLK